MDNIVKNIHFTSFQLKVIALVTMIIDHVGAVFFPEYLWFRIIGRLSFPIFCYLLVEGFFYTKNVILYMTRLLVMALISEVPFDLLFFGKILDFQHQNIFFTLFLGLLMMYVFAVRIETPVRVISAILLMLISELLHTDYSATGLLMILVFFLFRERRMLYRNLGVAGVNIGLMGGIQSFGAFALIPISLHNKEQGRRAKWFYAVYPVHLLILFVLRVIL